MFVFVCFLVNEHFDNSPPTTKNTPNIFKQQQQQQMFVLPVAIKQISSKRHSPAMA
jgi:hypothetical protein